VHPYHHPVIGWRQDVDALERDRMVGYYQRHYAPDRAVMVVAGDVQPEDTARRVRELFEPIPPSGQPRPQPVAEPTQRGERRVRLHFPGNIPRLHLAFRGCRVGDPDDFTLDVLQVILAGGKASRLYRTLVQGKELLSSISTYNEARLDPGLFWFMAELKSDSRLDMVEAELRKQIQKVRQDGVSAAELRRAHTLILSGFQFEQEAAMDMAMRIGRSECTAVDGHRLVPRYTEEILKVDRKRVQEAARRILDDRACTVGEVHPDGVK
jgi:zinc protease